MLKRIPSLTISFLLFSLLIHGTPLIAGQENSVGPVAVKTTGKKTQAPVTMDDRTLFMVREKIFSFSPADRANAISARLAKLRKDPLFHPDSISIADAEATTDIVAGDMIIMSVTDNDAKAEGKSRQETAKEYARLIRTAIEEHSREYSPNSILLGALYAFIVTAVIIALLAVFRRVFPRIYAKIESLRGTRIRSIRIQSFEIIHADRIAAMIIGTVKGCRVIVTIALFYFYIPIVFSFFPWTSGYAPRLFHYVYTPFISIGHAVGNYLPNLFFIAVIIIVTHFVIRFTRLLFSEIGKGAITLPGFYTDWAEPTFNIVRFLIIAFALIVAFPYFPGSDSPAFKGVSIFFGVLFSLGSTSAVANIVSGVILTYTRAFKIGDRVQISDTIGDAVITCDTNSRVTFLNPVAEALTGWSSEEARDRPIQEVFPIINEQTRQTAEDTAALVLRDGRTKTLANHTALVTRDGREIPIEDSAAPILDADGRVTGVVLVFHDVTEKRRAQESLRKSEERLKRSQEIAHLGSWELDLANPSSAVMKL